VRSILIPVLFAFAMLVPSIASAALVDAALVPDGTYVVKVEKVEDAQHLLVMMQNGVETTLVAQGVDFGKVKANDTLKVSLVKGKVPAFAIQ
jgi:type 1 fimbria pilin